MKGDLHRKLGRIAQHGFQRSEKPFCIAVPPTCDRIVDQASFDGAFALIHGKPWRPFAAMAGRSSWCFRSPLRVVQRSGRIARMHSGGWTPPITGSCPGARPHGSERRYRPSAVGPCRRENDHRDRTAPGATFACAASSAVTACRSSKDSNHLRSGVVRNTDSLDRMFTDSQWLHGAADIYGSEHPRERIFMDDSGYTSSGRNVRVYPAVHFLGDIFTGVRFPCEDGPRDFTSIIGSLLRCTNPIYPVEDDDREYKKAYKPASAIL